MSNSDKKRKMTGVAEDVRSILAGERNYVANAANAAAIVFNFFKNNEASGDYPPINWAGFYFVDKPEEMVLGPFQGKAACVRIKKGRGVCGTAWKDGKVQFIQDVHCFKGHIACDPDSNSEVVVPLYDPESKEFVGVLDVDSTGKVTENERDMLIEVADAMMAGCDWAPVVARLNTQSTK